MSVRIIVDSTADLLPEVASRLTVVPLSVRFGDREYVQGVDITNAQFYEMLVESDTLPTTSQATPYQFEAAFREAVEAGDTVVAITLSAKLSGTYQSAVIAAEEFPDKVFVVDSTSAAIGAGILIEYALQLVDRGLSAEDIAKSLLTQRERIYVVAMLDTLEYLKKGGRISKTVAFAGELLSIKPVVSIEGGEVKLLGKARGSKQGNNLLVKQIQAAGGVDFSMPLLLGYTGLSDVLLQKYITDSAILWESYRKELPQTLIGSVIGTHVGPGAVAVAFFSKNET